MKTPDYLNGHPVVGALKRSFGDFVVIVARDYDYVTAIWADQCDSSWFTGRYGFKTLDEAAQDAASRVS